MSQEMPLAITVLVEEFKILKAEQIARTGFRDNLIYVTVAAVGAVIVYSLGNDGRPPALAVIPWLVTILGWTYLVNDEKISAAGRYIRESLGPKLENLANVPDGHFFQWEFVHRSDLRRPGRKRWQLFIDLTTFVGSGLAALVVYIFWGGTPAPDRVIVVAIDGALLIALTWQILLYADLFEKPSSPDRQP